MPESVYIHIPFCKSKCKYCSFVSSVQTDIIEEYVQALIKEIDFYYKSNRLRTLYFGGGTPSLMPSNLIELILQKFNISQDTEITFEINPDDSKESYLKDLKCLGINRLSFGAQTFNDRILKLIGRRHSAKDILKSVEIANNVGFKNVSIDLIYGLPEQTQNILEADLRIVERINIKHVSTYGLKIEEPSFYFFNKPRNIPNDDKQADMYLLINKFLSDIGFKRYEISNFSLQGYESKHNLNYWNNAEYYGFGVAAHGYKDGMRYSNSENITDYISNPLKHKTEHFVSIQEKLEEEIFLGFRKESGIDINHINKSFGIDFEKKYERVLKRYLPDLIEKTESGYKLTLNGVLLSNNILADFLD